MEETPIVIASDAYTRGEVLLWCFVTFVTSYAAGFFTALMEVVK